MFKIIAWLFLFPGIAMAQADSVNTKIKYCYSIVSGVMIGSNEDEEEKEFSVSFTTIHGIKFKNGVKVGIGAGMDTYYGLKAFPLLGSVAVDLETKKHGLFLQLNSGYSFVRYTREPEIEQIQIGETGGLMINPMIGYRMVVENMRIYLLAGYKYQEAELQYKYPDWWGVSQSSKQYELNRFVIQLGFGLE